MKQPLSKPYYSTSEAARILGISRIAVFQQIRDGRLKAERYGRNYLVGRESLAYQAGFLTTERKQEIKRTVHRVLLRYGEAFRRLAKN